MTLQSRLTILKAGLWDGDDLDTSSSIVVQRRFDNTKVTWNELLAKDVSEADTGHDYAYPTASNISMETTRSKAPFQLSGRLTMSTTRRVVHMIDSLSVIHEPNPDSPCQACCLDTVLCQCFLLGRQSDGIDSTTGCPDSLQDVSVRAEDIVRRTGYILRLQRTPSQIRFREHDDQLGYRPSV